MSQEEENKRRKKSENVIDSDFSKNLYPSLEWGYNK
jgi:hypothetical protein